MERILNTANGHMPKIEGGGMNFSGQADSLLVRLAAE